MLPEEAPIAQNAAEPHSPFNLVSNSIIPEKCKKLVLRGRSKSSVRNGGGVRSSLGFTTTSPNSTAKKMGKPSKSSGKLAYNAFYENQNYHIIHERGPTNQHEMRIEVNNAN